VIEEILRLAGCDEAHFWATHTGAELDLFLMKQGWRYGVEVKFQDAPRLTPSMRVALEDLRLDHLTVLYPGDRAYSLAERVTVVPVAQLAAGDAAVFMPRVRRQRGATTGRRTTANRRTR
jgi:predicted AAA+ superfamily ATPase